MGHLLLGKGLSPHASYVHTVRMAYALDENTAYCRNCNEYHEADSPEAAEQLVQDCEAGNW